MEDMEDLEPKENDALPGDNKGSDEQRTINRRDLLQRGSVLALGLLAGGGAASGLHAEELQAPAQQPAQTPPAPAAAGAAAAPRVAPAANVASVAVAVIGLGDQGRQHLAALHHVPGAQVRYVCDIYEPIHKRALELAPKATAVTDYRRVLDDKAVQAVYVATPSHLHREIVLAALQAGKHVYCESPLASSVDDARAIAKAALGTPKQVFHSGLQQRTNPQHRHVLQFVRTGAVGKMAMIKSQWNKKTSWRRPAPTDERQQALNWRLSKATSGGLMGEIGVHQVDVGNWFLKAMPVSVTGTGGILAWRDGRDVYDTIQCIVEYPGDIHLSYVATLANSYDGAYEQFHGTDAAVVLRDGRAWMFKEADATALGWEVYAFKERIGEETGIVLVADATKLLERGLKPSENRDTDPTRGSLYFASDHFLTAIRENKKTDAGPEEGYQATVTALKANEAIMAGTSVAFQKEWFDLTAAA